MDRRGLAFVVACTISCVPAPVVDPPTNAGDDGGCRVGFDSRSGACVPRLDRCDPAGVPRVGGGCDRAGVPSGGCASGFTFDGAGGCTAVLPIARCEQGWFAVPGESACRSLAERTPCGAAPFGDGPFDASSVFVDASASATGADGSRDRPFTKVADGVRAAKDGGSVVIAAGTYRENLVVTRSLSLRGRCPSMVTIEGDPARPGTQTIIMRGTSGAVRGIAVVGPGPGILLRDGNFRVEEVWVHDTADAGITVLSPDAPTEVTVRHALVERVDLYGLHAVGAKLVVEESAVRDVQPREEGPVGGDGINALLDFGAKRPAELVIRKSLIERTQAAGIDVQGTTARVEGTVVRDTGSTTGKHAYGIGMVVQDEPTTGVKSDVNVSQTLFERSTLSGMLVEGSKAVFDRVVVRDTRPRETDGLYGRGMILSLGSEVHIHDSLIEKSREGGVAIFGSFVTLERCIVRDTSPQLADGTLGFGVAAVFLDRAAEVTLLGSRIERAHYVGVATFASHVRVNRCLVRDVLALDDARFGDGIAAISLASRASAVVTGTVVEHCARAGVSCFGADVKLGDSVLTCNGPDLAAARAGEKASSLVDLGGTTCGCATSFGSCQAATDELEPISAPLPTK